LKKINYDLISQNSKYFQQIIKLENFIKNYKTNGTQKLEMLNRNSHFDNNIKVNIEPYPKI